MTTAVRYPKGPITPAGAYHALKGLPLIKLKAFDKSVTVTIAGGPTFVDRTLPESVVLKGIKVSPSWRMIKQKGAAQNGVDVVTSLYDEAEIELRVVLSARDGRHLRQLRDHLLGSIDANQVSTLEFWTFDRGVWYADVRWAKGPPEPLRIGDRRTQELTLILQADSGFVRGPDHVDQFTMRFDSMADAFATNYRSALNLGPNWPQWYDGDGGGFCTTEGRGAYWFDDPDDTWTTLSREVVNGPYRNFDTDTDNQVVTIKIGSMQEFGFPTPAANDIWFRMGRFPNGAWNGYGGRLRIEASQVTLSRFSAFAKTDLRRALIFPPPLPTEEFTVIAGFENNPRRFSALRNGTELWGMNVVESGTGSALGPQFRGVGFGMKAAAAIFTQATPARVLEIRAGDNGTISQSGTLTRINNGELVMPDRYTCYGPGIFKIGNGPGSDEFIEFGPLLPNQVVQIRTSPNGHHGLVDLSSKPPTPQELELWQKALKDLVTWASGNNVPPLLEEFLSVFGIMPPQGNLYTLLKGRFSNPIPAKSPGRSAQHYTVNVKIDDGNAASKIVAAGTPLRKFPV